MLIRLAGGRVIDPVQGLDAVGDIYVRDGRIVAAPEPGEAVDETHDCRSRIVMAGAIDVHSHIAGGNVTLARLLLPELHVNEAPSPDGMPFAHARWSSWEIGRLYAEMGFTTVIEPALAPTHALQTHLELADLPVIDKGALTVVGNDDLLLKLLRERESRDAVRDAVAHALAASRGLGLKVINAGGAPAFKSNLRSFSFDDEVPHYGLTSRRIVTGLLDAAAEIGVPHPLHVHCNNLGVPGATETVRATMAGAEGRPIHLAHIQFYAYEEDPAGLFRSGAEAVAAALAAHPNVSVDVGQVMFGPTVTISLDIMKQYSGHAHASPKKWALVDGDAEGGGIVPIDYRAKSWVNQLQWAIGLELFLLSPDPWRCLMTTDHPNGGPFTSYPEILHLLMDRGERARWIARMPEEAKRRCGLAALEREYTLDEVAIMTRAAPARLLGLADRGHLKPGAVADIAVYDDLADRAAMFRAARLVLKDGRVAVRDGRCTGWIFGRTHTLKPGYDAAMTREVETYLTDRYGVGAKAFAVPDDAFGERHVFKVEPCSH
ncbi:formylmethanofuran dehydrogenase subunit A [Prosthecodimorpha staleyi]|uniref:Formylmethanofuran dehydrogenase subunit A n=1 Tax=Prosthecodimorpha staleyi TaxID=2840188 RepID=A0A947GEF6_9HYPH|nr:formylmethanofuran dehydrogenase subunit A [Prosthecodimorpha staleyi]MBT9291887.1 formylmethanofuran dehydrogenase subunit A [Prosthecodimorpha staleyi]